MSSTTREYPVIRTGYFTAQKLGTERWCIAYHRPRSNDLIVVVDNLDYHSAFDLKDQLNKMLQPFGQPGWSRIREDQPS